MCYVYEKDRRWCWKISSDDTAYLRRILSYLSSLPFVLATCLTTERRLSNFLKRNALNPLRKLQPPPLNSPLNIGVYNDQVIYQYPSGSSFQSDTSDWYESVIYFGLTQEINLNGVGSDNLNEALDRLESDLREFGNHLKDPTDARRSTNTAKKCVNVANRMSQLLTATESLIKAFQTEGTPTNVQDIFRQQQRLVDLNKSFEHHYDRLKTGAEKANDSDDNEDEEDNDDR